MQTYSLEAALCCCAILSSCSRDAAPVAARDTFALEAGDVSFSDPQAGVTFPLPEAGIAVAAEHFDDPTLELVKWRHEVRLSDADGDAVLVHVWLNPARVPLDIWFARTLQFMADDVGASVTESAFSLAAAPGLLVLTPRSPQAPSFAAAVFAHGDRVYRVTCIGYDERPDARRLFYKVVDGMLPGGRP